MMKSTTIMARSISQDSRHEYPNSDTKLERTHLSDAQYIEQLLFENKELNMMASFTSLNHYVTVINHFYRRNKALNA